MAVTIDSISHGRFGLNVITGWQRPEYSQMGLWPGDEYFTRRYEYLGEYVRVMRELWETGASDFKGDFFKMDDCRLSPRPQAPMKIICAGQSDAGLEFSAEWADYNFCLGKGVNTPTAFAPVVGKMQAAAARTGRHVTTFVLVMLIMADTDEEAMAKWKHYNAGADVQAMAWLREQASVDTRSGADTNVRQLGAPEGAVNLNFGTLVGSYASVARMLDEIAAVPGLEGVLLTFDEFVSGVTLFGEKVQPLMQSRKDVPVLAEVA
jgi:pyrimidine oxygenase